MAVPSDTSAISIGTLRARSQAANQDGCDPRFELTFSEGAARHLRESRNQIPKANRSTSSLRADKSQAPRHDDLSEFANLVVRRVAAAAGWNISRKPLESGGLCEVASLRTNACAGGQRDLV